MEGNTVGLQAQLFGQHQQVHCHISLATELARQRPVGGGGAFGQDADIDFRTRCGLGDVAQVGFGVGGVQAHTLFIESTDVTGFLDGVAKADLFGFDAQRQHLLQLIDGGDVEVGAFVAQQRQYFIGRVGLYRVVHLGKGEAVDQLVVSTVNGFQVNDEKGRFVLIGTGLDATKSVAVEIIFQFDGHGVGSKALSSGDGPCETNRGSDMQGRGARVRSARLSRNLQYAFRRKRL